MQVLIYAAIIGLGIFVGLHLTPDGIFVMGLLIAALHAYFWKKDAFNEGLASLVPIMIMVVLWVVWTIGVGVLVHENWATISLKITPVTSIFFR